MTTDPIRFRPGRHEQRGEFPRHAEDPGEVRSRRQLSGRDAADLAVAALVAWRAEHPAPVRGADPVVP